MRIAFAPTTSVGLRAGRVLLADERVEALGAFQADIRSPDPRVQEIHSLAGWDVVMTDASPDDARFVSAVEHQIPIITDRPLAEVSPVAGTTPLIAAASIHSGLLASIASTAIRPFDSITSATAAVTVPKGKTSRRHSQQFPDPVGSLWCDPVGSPVANPDCLSYFNAPYDGPLVGLSVRVSGMIGGHQQVALHGVVDDPIFLGAITLAGAALLFLDRNEQSDQIEVQSIAQDYLNTCQTAGMGIATFTAA